MTTLHKPFLIATLATITSLTTFAQTNSLAAKEARLAKLYSKMLSFHHVDYDSLEVYSEKFAKEFVRFINSNPGTLNHPFKILDKDSSFLQIQTSRDGKFRIYGWDTQTGGTMRYFRNIYQWKGNEKVLTKYESGGEDDNASICYEMYTVMISNKAHYLAIKNSIGSTRDRGVSISAYRIDGDKLNDEVKVFKTKNETLNTIDAYIDLGTVAEDYKNEPVISYDARQKIVYIPFVNGKDNVLTNKYLMYKLKGRYFEYIGTTTTSKSGGPPQLSANGIDHIQGKNI
jgi:hypothetical protein